MLGSIIQYPDYITKILWFYYIMLTLWDMIQSLRLNISLIKAIEKPIPIILAHEDL